MVLFSSIRFYTMATTSNSSNTGHILRTQVSVIRLPAVSCILQFRWRFLYGTTGGDLPSAYVWCCTAGTKYLHCVLDGSYINALGTDMTHKVHTEWKTNHCDWNRVAIQYISKIGSLNLSTLPPATSTLLKPREYFALPQHTRFDDFLWKRESITSIRSANRINATAVSHDPLNKVYQE